MQPFDHFTPASLPEALELLANRNGEAKVIAGGTDLLIQMRNGLIAPTCIVNIKRLPELKGITFDKEGGLIIGALTTLREIRISPIIQEHYPALSSAAQVMGSEQIRAFATVGGNLCNGSPSADQAQPLIALEARAHIVGQMGERNLPLEEFFLGNGQTALKPGELLKEIHVSPVQGETIFMKHTPRTYMDISVVCIALRLVLEVDRCQDARIVLGAVAPTPMRARGAEAKLIGQPLAPERIDQVAEIAASECKPITDPKGSAWYRRRMVKVMVRRGLLSFIQG